MYEYVCVCVCVCVCQALPSTACTPPMHMQEIPQQKRHQSQHQDAESPRHTHTHTQTHTHILVLQYGICVFVFYRSISTVPGTTLPPFHLRALGADVRLPERHGCQYAQHRLRYFYVAWVRSLHIRRG